MTSLDAVSAMAASRELSLDAQVSESLDAQVQARTRCKRCVRWAGHWTDFRLERDPTRSLGLPGALVRHLPALYTRRFDTAGFLLPESVIWRPLCGHPYHGAEWLGEPW